MADKKDKNPKKGEGKAPEPDSGATEQDDGVEATEQEATEQDDGVEATEQEATEQDDTLIEAEGPDVETSLSDADLAFLEQSADTLAAERLADLQRLQAEYVNYRNRVERDREASKQAVVADVAKTLLPILDDLDRAEAHGDLEEGGAMALIAQKFRGTVERMGVTKVGTKDEPFDHNVHEAIVQVPTPGVDEMTVADVVEIGYQLGSRLLRPAKVAVAVPQE